MRTQLASIRLVVVNVSRQNSPDSGSHGLTLGTARSGTVPHSTETFQMGHNSVYEPRYRQSWALVIGINDYQFEGRLAFARNDAEVVASSLQKQLAFSEENITLLVDENATRDSIRASFHRFTKSDIADDDRIIVFFAGHGFTRPSHRNDVGYLVPVDGRTGDLSTLIRWDELTRDADLIPAKHLFFVIDACFGGLAIPRGLPAGSNRFVKDMRSRFSRQVLASGKGDETVADGYGPRLPWSWLAQCG